MNSFIPKNIKYKKIRKRVRIHKNNESRAYNLKHGTFGLKLLNSGNISSTVFESARRSIIKKVKKTGSLHINGFPNTPLTKKSLGVRMGKGTGSIDHWIFPAKRGRVLFELKGVSENLAKSAFHSASHKLPMKSKFISKK